MAFKVGDRVSVLDEDLSGKIIKIKNDTLTVLTTDGFELEFQSTEVVSIEKETPLKSDIYLQVPFSEVLKEKETINKKKPIKNSAKERYQPTMEIDLHIHQLTDKPNRLNNYEKLNLQVDTARRQLEFAINKRIQKIVFIHGVGEGILKTELEYLFGRYSNVKFYDADYQKYGLGATEVYVFQNIKP